jgi:hypothetical protein
VEVNRIVQAMALVVAAAGAVPASERLFYDGFEEAVDYCTDPLVMPVGWAVKEKSWVAAFSRPGGVPAGIYPNSVGNPVPVPGYEWFVRPQNGQFQFHTKGSIVAIPFTPLEGVSVDMTWDTAQSGPNYTTPRPANQMFVGLSPCKGDVRADFLNGACWRASGLDSMFYTTLKPAPPAACGVEAGVTYYINVMMATPYTVADPSAHSCNDAAQNTITYNGCDVQMRHTGY